MGGRRVGPEGYQVMDGVGSIVGDRQFQRGLAVGVWQGPDGGVWRGLAGDVLGSGVSCLLSAHHSAVQRYRGPAQS